MLEDHADTGGDRIGRGLEMNLGAIDEDMAVIGLLDAVQDLHESRFAGAVLADQGVNRAGPDHHIDVVIGDHAGEPFADSLESDRLDGVSHCQSSPQESFAGTTRPREPGSNATASDPGSRL